MRTKHVPKPKREPPREGAARSATTGVPLKVLRLREVQARVPLSRSTIWRLIQKGEFPRGISLTGGHAVGWREDLVDAWLRGRCGE